jgi:23S rRNA pseudouridine1911/1915/1917 synthase
VPDTWQTLEAGADDEGSRLDAFVSRHTAAPRSQVEKLVKQGRVLVNGRPAKPGHKLEPGQQVRVQLPSPEAPTLRPERAALAILYEDDDVIVLSKPPGLAVHPGAGRAGGTLVNALLAHVPTLAGGESQRPGIVHRLDRDTSGVMVVAKHPKAYAHLSRQVRAREMERRYLALAWGVIREDRLIVEVPLARHGAERTRMAVASLPGAREAVTDLRVQSRFPHMTLVEARLVTGRTHQIRVHLAHLGHPVVGDPVYGRKTAKRLEVELENRTLELVHALPGQALHAQSLTFRHPVTGREMTFSAPQPAEMARLLVHLQAAMLS